MARKDNKHCRSVLLLGGLACLLSSGGNALASPFDHFGVSSRAAAMGGAYTALATDFTGTYYNPAALVFSDGAPVGLGTMLASYRLEVNGEVKDIDTLYGITAGASLPLKGMFEGRTALGILIFLARHNLLYDMTSVSQDEPKFIIEEDRPAHMQIIPALSVRLTPGLSLGAGLQVNQYLWSRVVVQTDTQALLGTPGSPLPLSNMDVTNLYKGFPTGGIFFRPWESLSFGLVYREDMHFRLDVDSILLITGADLLGAASSEAEVSLLIKCLIHYTPRQATLGTAYQPDSRITLSLDITWMDWSEFPNPAPRMEASSPVPEINTALANTVPSIAEPLKPGFSDTIGAKLGGEYLIFDWLRFRGGYQYVPSPVPDQPEGTTNFLDCDRHVVTLGAGFEFIDPVGISVRPVHVDLHLQYHHFVERKNTRDYTGRGSVLNTGLNLEFSF